MPACRRLLLNLNVRRVLPASSKSAPADDFDFYDSVTSTNIALTNERAKAPSIFSPPNTDCSGLASSRSVPLPTSFLRLLLSYASHSPLARLPTLVAFPSGTHSRIHPSALPNTFTDSLPVHA